jgi:hypothetical protein
MRSSPCFSVKRGCLAPFFLLFFHLQLRFGLWGFRSFHFFLFGIHFLFHGFCYLPFTFLSAGFDFFAPFDALRLAEARIAPADFLL